MRKVDFSLALAIVAGIVASLTAIYSVAFALQQATPN
jgi:hypothetical protein